MVCDCSKLLNSGCDDIDCLISEYSCSASSLDFFPANFKEAFKGDLKAYQEILDRLEGRAKQTNEIELSGGLQINWEEKKTYVEKTGSL